MGDERAVADLRDADLASVRLSGDERLVTLAQALSAVTPERMVLIDTKTEDVELIEAVVGEVARLNAVDRCRRCRRTCRSSRSNWWSRCATSCGKAAATPS